MMLIY